MKRLFIACICLLSLSDCNRIATQGFNTYFWTSTPGIKMLLYIEGEKKGELTYFGTAPDCDNELSKRGTLKVYLPSGQYLLEVKDSAENVLFSEELRIWKRGGNLSIGTTKPVEDGGSSRRTFKDNCLIEELSYDPG